MGHKYPRIGRILALDFFRICECCTQPATKSIHVQFTRMRGDDEVYAVCPFHLAMAKTDPILFCHAHRDRERIKEGKP